MSYTLQPDHYPGQKITVNSEKGELTLQSFEPYSKSRPHLVEISVNGNTGLIGLSNLQGCFTSCKGAEVGEKKFSGTFTSNGLIEIITVVRNSSKDNRLVKIKLGKNSVTVSNRDFQKTLTELKQHRTKKLQSQ